MANRLLAPPIGGMSVQSTRRGVVAGAAANAGSSDGVRKPVSMRQLGSPGPEISKGTSKPSSDSGRVRRDARQDPVPLVRAAAAAATAQTAVALRRPATTMVPTTPSRPVTLVDVEVVEALERPSSTDFKWSQDSYSELQRTVDTWTFFSVFRTRLALLDQKWSYLGGFTEAKKAARTRSLAQYLLKSVLDLGPTFIKIGQLSSTRSDLFPAEFVQELSKLQDRVPAFSASKAQEIIELDLGQPISRLFRTFDPQPIAAASLGQVHRATLMTGEQVVVKVQRPGLKQLFDIDLKNLRLLAEQLDKADENDGRDFKGIYQECAQVLYEEIDYINEGRNSDRFRRDFRNTPWVKVPTVYWQYCSPRVLVMSYMPGTKISAAQSLKAQGLDTELIARRATEAYLTQILKTGFFHADPHPGNVSVDSQGNLVFYDFGMMGQIVPDVRERLLDMFYGIYRKDTQAVLQALIELKVIKTTGDMLTVRRTLSYFIENLARQTERQEAISAIGEDLFLLAVDQPFRFPATFTFVLRAFSTLEGIGKTLNPDYSFAAVATPYAQELLAIQDMRGSNLFVNQLQQQATEMGNNMAAMPLRVQRMDQLLNSMESGDTKLRVRVLEAERAARRASIMQSATLNVVGAMGMLNMGTMLALSEHQGPAALALAVGGVFSALTWVGFRRVKRLDKFEKDLKA